MLIKEIMTTKTESITPDLSIQDAAREMSKLNIGSLPVINNGQLVGIITDRDICCRGVGDGCNPKTTTVQQIMTKDVTCCFNDQDITDAAHLMEDKHIRRLAVLNRDNSMAGFVSVDDLARYSHDLAGEILEAVGPIH